jgi:hypothetical protein
VLGGSPLITNRAPELINIFSLIRRATQNFIRTLVSPNHLPAENNNNTANKDTVTDAYCLVVRIPGDRSRDPGFDARRYKIF